jgi:hypothetical protein
MTRIVLPFAALVAALSPLVDAGVKFTSPKAGDKLTAGTAVTVKWEEGGTGPKLTDLATYQLQVMVGDNNGLQVGRNQCIWYRRKDGMLMRGNSSQWALSRLAVHLQLGT